MPTELINILAQVPILAIFIWYATETHKRQSEAQDKFIEALSKQEECFETRVHQLSATLETERSELTAALEKLSGAIHSQEMYLRETLGRIRDQGRYRD